MGRIGVCGLTLLCVAGCGEADNDAPSAVLAGPDVVRVDAPATFDGSQSTDRQGPIVAWYFDFGDETFTSGESPVEPHIYKKAGKYTVTLTVRDAQRTEHTVAREIVVTPNLPPVAAFTSPDAARVHTAVAFDATGSTDPDGDVAAYAWDMDMDGAYDDASGANVSWTFATPGKQIVGLQVLDNDGDRAVAQAEITIDDDLAPVAAFTGPNRLVALETGTFDATGASDPDGILERYEWDLHYDHITFEPQKSGTVINVSFPAAGTYSVALRVTDNEGKQATTSAEVEVRSHAQHYPLPVAQFTGPLTARERDPVGFDSSGSRTEAGSIVAREWDLDYEDGDFETMATGSAVAYAFPAPGQAVVALRITVAYEDGSEAEALTTQALTVVANQLPVALFAAPAVGEVAVPVTLDASASADADGHVVAWEWDFSYNGFAFLSEAKGVAVTHAFAEPGSYTVALRVTDDNGAQGLSTRAVVIVANMPPLADLKGPTVATVGEAVVLDAAGSADPDGVITGYRWDFDGNGVDDAVGTAGTATYAYVSADAGTRMARVTVVDDDGAEASATWAVLVKTVAAASAPPIASFTGPGTVRQNVPAAFDASGSSGGRGTITNYEWDFAFKTPAEFHADATGIAVTHAFAAPGNYLVAIRISAVYPDGSTTRVVASRSIEVTANQVPVATFEGQARVVVGDAVTFDGSGSTDHDGTVRAWDWDFAYSGVLAEFAVEASGIAVTHTFTVPGTVLVALRVTDSDGAQTMVTTAVEVVANQPPVARIAGPAGTVSGLLASFDGTGSTDADGALAAYAWDFSYDGLTFHAEGVGAKASRTYTSAEAGVVTVALRVTDDKGATGIATQALEIKTQAAVNSPPVASFTSPATVREARAALFDGSASAAPGGTITAREWDFDYDGATFAFPVDANGIAPQHTYANAGTYLVAHRVTATYPDGSTAVVTVTRTIVASANLPPVAVLGGDTGAKVGVAARFDGSDSSDPDGTVETYAWDFSYNPSDGFSWEATGVGTGHVFQEAGTWVVALLVTDNDGASVLATRTINVVANQSPVGAFASASSGLVGEIVAFDATGSVDPDGSLVAWEWDFDYAAPNFAIGQTGRVVDHTFASAGTYTVALRVIDDLGASALATRQVLIQTVADGNPPPTASFTAPSTARVERAVSFDASASSTTAGTIVSYEWDFAFDGQFAVEATGAVQSHAFASAGDVVVALRVTSRYSDGSTKQSTSTHSLQVTPNQVPIADFSAPASVRVGHPARFDGSASQDPDGAITGFEWDFDYDGAFVADAESAVGTTTYGAPGRYVVALRVTDGDGAQGLLTKSVDVVANAPPVARITGPTEADIGTPASFDGGSSSDPDGAVVKWEWDMDFDGVTFGVDATSQAPAFTFSAAKTYVVALRVTDDEGAAVLATHAVAVSELNQLSVSAVAPAHGPRSGGTVITLRGTAFTQASDMSVQVGGAPATGIVVVDSTTLRCTTPPGLPGPAPIRVVNAHGDVTLAGGNGGFTFDGASNLADSEFCWMDATVGTVLIPGGAGSDDATAAIDLPFDFAYFGTVYPAGSKLNVCTNGWMSFTDATSAFADSAIPSAANPANMIAPLFFDQALGAGGMVVWHVFGVAPDRQLVVTWEDATEAGTMTDRYTYQAILYEGSHDTKFQYLNTASFDTTWTNDREAGAQATIGLQGPSGAVGAGFSSNAAQRGLAPGGRAIRMSANAAGTTYGAQSDLTLTVVGTSLATGSMHGTGSSFNVEFSRAVDPATIIVSTPPRDTDTVQIYRTSSPGQRVDIGTVLATDKQTLTITITGSLLISENYTVSIGRLMTPQGHVHSADPIAGSVCPDGLPVTPYTNTFESAVTVQNTFNNGSVPTGIAYDPVTHRVHVATAGTQDRIYAYDATTHALLNVADFPTHDSYDPMRAVVVAGTGRLYTSNYLDSSVTTWDVTNAQPVFVTTTALGGGPAGLVVDAAQQRVYTTFTDDDLIAALNVSSAVSTPVCDINSSGLSSTLDPSGATNAYTPALALAWDPTNANRYFMANDQFIYRISRGASCGSSDAVIQAVDLNAAPVTSGTSNAVWDIAVVHDATRTPATKIYLSEFDDDRLTILRLSATDTLEYHGRIDGIPRIAGLEVTSTGQLAIASDGDSELQFLDPASDTITAGVHLANCDSANFRDGFDLAIARLATGDEYWVTCPSNDRVQVIR